MPKSGLEIGFLLDRQWHLLRGEMEQSKRPTLLRLAQILSEESVAYAIIGGLALQVHHAEPRTTLDIDIAVTGRDRIPRAALIKSGFQETGSFQHSENWKGPDGTVVQFTSDPALAGAIARADEIPLQDRKLRVITAADLLHEKLRAGADSARRRSKRLQDLVDAQALIDAKPALASELTAAERALLGRLPE
jgi:hypothetical protein